MASKTVLLLSITALLPLLIVCQLTDASINHASKGPQQTFLNHFIVAKCREDTERKAANCEGLDLTRVPDDLLSDIQNLSLSYNRIDTLHNSSFLKYQQLRELDLSHNDLRIIESATFLPLALLEYIDMSYNHNLVNINPIIFNWSHSLSTLIMHHCGLTSFPKSKSQQWFKGMRFLDFNYNNISSINITCTPGDSKKISILLSHNDFQELTPENFRLDCDVDKLQLFDVPLKRIRLNTLAALRVRDFGIGDSEMTAQTWNDVITEISRSHIQTLTIFGGNPNTFRPNLFSPLYNYPLFSLECEDCIYPGLDTSNGTIFSYLNLVHELTVVQREDIGVLDPNWFRGMIEIRVLHLEMNGIRDINPHEYTWSTLNLRKIYLCQNHDLTTITPTSFRGLNNVTYLDLANNKNLWYVVIAAFAGLSSLRHLNVSNTRIVYLDLYRLPVLISISAATSGGKIRRQQHYKFNTPSLKRLDLSASNLLLTYLWHAEQNRSGFDHLHNLTYLLLPHNPLTTLVPALFRKLTALEFLDLSNCQISVIPPNVFFGLSALQTLLLAGNNIRRLPVYLLADLNALQIYNLTNNEIDFVDNEIFAHAKSLQTLLLAANQLSDFNQSTFQPIMSILKEIDISQNPLICDCKISWLVKWLDGQVNVLNDYDTVCSKVFATLEPLRGKPLLTFNPNKLCGPNIALMCSVPLAVITFLATLYLVYHFRWLVKFKVYLLKLAVLGYEEVVDAREHGDFEYDLNIMFMEDDAQWVQEHLRPVLEERLPNFNRNAFGDDDLIPGMYYFDAVFHIIERSFKTVILLSRAAFQDNWFMIKFRTAFEHVNDARMENVVLIFLEDIPDAELPYLVRLYLSERRTYFWWTEDVRGQEYFWNELILTLQRDNMRWNNLIPPE